MEKHEQGSDWRVLFPLQSGVAQDALSAARIAVPSSSSPIVADVYAKIFTEHDTVTVHRLAKGDSNTGESARRTAVWAQSANGGDPEQGMVGKDKTRVRMQLPRSRVPRGVTLVKGHQQRSERRGSSLTGTFDRSTHVLLLQVEVCMSLRCDDTESPCVPPNPFAKIVAVPSVTAVMHARSSRADGKPLVLDASSHFELSLHSGTHEEAELATFSGKGLFRAVVHSSCTAPLDGLGELQLLLGLDLLGVAHGEGSKQKITINKSQAHDKCANLCAEEALVQSQLRSMQTSHTQQQLTSNYTFSANSGYEALSSSSSTPLAATTSVERRRWCGFLQHPTLQSPASLLAALKEQQRIRRQPIIVLEKDIKQQQTAESCDDDGDGEEERDEGLLLSLLTESEDEPHRHQQPTTPTKRAKRIRSEDLKNETDDGSARNKKDGQNKSKSELSHCTLVLAQLSTTRAIDVALQSLHSVFPNQTGPSSHRTAPTVFSSSQRCWISDASAMQLMSVLPTDTSGNQLLFMCPVDENSNTAT